ncbi:hypothetical protein GQ53DRAFT_778019 [Thozetella sp. PMI_491]|nr:hypothetical protein GQ53DRAFT_778019 [Thozetella sp. PMI_491]
MENGSPEGRPSSHAIVPTALADARAVCEKARRVSAELRKTFESLSRKIEPDVEPDQEQLEVDRQAGLQLASLGVELASKEKEAIRLEREVIAKEQDAGILHPEAARKRLRSLSQRYFSAGDDLWRHQKKKIRFDDPGTVRLFEPRANGLSECLLALYKKSDGLDKKRKRPSNWRRDTLAYYAGIRDVCDKPENELVWCHISGMWHLGDTVKAAHIVPFFLDMESIGEILFGSRAESLQRAGNALLLSNRIKGWFDGYHLVVVPVDAQETPIKRWRTDVISADIQNTPYMIYHPAKELDGKELVFLNEKRPVSRFLYFHFIMALVRIKDLRRQGWQDIWARYYEQRPFPTPGNYMRQSMLLALATHFESVDMHVVESWIVDHGFESQLKLAEDEAMEAARRVHAAVEAVTSRAEKSWHPGRNSLEEKSSEEESSEEESSEEESSEEESSDRDTSGALGSGEED